jgi:NAD(P)H-dependent FMN reductase
MKVVCLSASNIKPARQHSASTHTCELIRNLLVEIQPSIEVEIVPLIDYAMKPCRMCGECLPTLRCSQDEDFNQVHDRLQSAEAVFLVCPHYAPIPSKVMILLEKLEEMAYLKYCQDNTSVTPLHGKPIGIIAHGGQTEEALPYYKNALLDPLANAFASVQMRVIGAGEQWPNGVTFGIESLTMPTDSIFVTIEHDWQVIRQRIQPLVENVIAAI